MHRVTFASVAIVAFLTTSSTASAGAISFSMPGVGEESVTLEAAGLFDTSETNLQIALRATGEPSGNGTDPTFPFNTLTANLASSPLISGEIAFVMTIAGGSLLGPISNVSFQHGADLSEPKLPAGVAAPASIPEPATLLLLAPAIGLVVRRRFVRAKTVR